MSITAAPPSLPRGVAVALPSEEPASTMIHPDDALTRVIAASELLDPVPVTLDDCVGLTLARAVAADRHYPTLPRAMMDGYAVCRADAGQVIEVRGEVAAGQLGELAVGPGVTVEIMTGAACPPGTEAVVPKELVRHEGTRVRLPADIAPGSHIAPIGSECRAGTVVLRPGDTIAPLAVAVLASLGVESVLVHPRPTLAIITTGAELVAAGATPAPHQIRDSNGPMLAALARRIGLEKPLRLHVGDRLDEILAALAATAGHDLVLLTGGVSAGRYDLVPQALRGHGATVLFHKVRQKPGKPLLVARRGRQLIFGLPGNPLACHLGFSRYVAPAMRVMAGQTPLAPRFRGRLAADVAYRGGRTFYCLARAVHDPAAVGGWHIEPLPGVSSADIFTPSGANCYVEVPAGESSLAAGEQVDFEWVCGTT